MTVPRYVIGLVGVLAVFISFPFAFFVFVAGAFASDSGTTAALTVAFVLMGLAFIYPILTGIAAVWAWRKRSLITAIIPLIPPFLFFVVIFGPFN